MSKSNIPFFTKLNTPLSIDSATDFSNDEEIVEQHHLRDTDINSVYKHWIAKSSIPINHEHLSYIDCADFKDYQHAQELLVRTQAEFAKLSSELRGMFDNDPGKLILFLDDPKNYDKARELGILEKNPSINPPGSGSGPDCPSSAAKLERIKYVIDNVPDAVQTNVSTSGDKVPSDGKVPSVKS